RLLLLEDIFRINLVARYLKRSDNGGTLHSICIEIIGVEHIAPVIIRLIHKSRLS
ncbi:hypothetical protein evm_015590, partial [Chilo suppressalis]